MCWQGRFLGLIRAMEKNWHAVLFDRDTKAATLVRVAHTANRAISNKGRLTVRFQNM